MIAKFLVLLYFSDYYNKKIHFNLGSFIIGQSGDFSFIKIDRVF